MTIDERKARIEAAATLAKRMFRIFLLRASSGSAVEIVIKRSKSIFIEIN